jgi:methyl-accepting chemotaxis protein
MPLRKTVTVLQDMADGDLTGRLDLDSSDEFGDMARALNSSVDILRAVIRQIGEDADALTGFAERASEQTRSVATMLDEQGLGETAASLIGDTETTAQNLAGMAETLHNMTAIFVTEGPQAAFTNGASSIDRDAEPPAEAVTEVRNVVDGTRVAP